MIGRKKFNKLNDKITKLSENIINIDARSRANTLNIDTIERINSVLYDKIELMNLKLEVLEQKERMRDILGSSEYESALNSFNEGLEEENEGVQPVNNNLEEEFRSVPSFPGVEVSNLGNVKRILRGGKVNISKGVFNKVTGYYNTAVNIGGKRVLRGVHSLIIEAFTGNKSNSKMHVNHINFDKSDNRLENLEFVTARENANQKHLKSTSKYTGVCKFRKQWKASIVFEGKAVHLGLFDTELDASNAYQLALANIRNGEFVAPPVKVKSSVFKGVTKVGEKWRANIWIDGKTKHLGLFDVEEDAANVYLDAKNAVKGAELAKAASMSMRAYNSFNQDALIF